MDLDQHLSCGASRGPPSLSLISRICSWLHLPLALPCFVRLNSTMFFSHNKSTYNTLNRDFSEQCYDDALLLASSSMYHQAGGWPLHRRPWEENENAIIAPANFLPLLLTPYYQNHRKITLPSARKGPLCLFQSHINRQSVASQAFIHSFMV